MAKIKARIPKKAGKGEPVEIKCIIEHPMETGRRKDDSGNVIPRKIINRFVCTLNGEVAFASDWMPSVSADPFLTFFVAPRESGTIELKWIDDDGTEYTKTGKITVG